MHKQSLSLASTGTMRDARNLSLSTSGAPAAALELVRLSMASTSTIKNARSLSLSTSVAPAAALELVRRVPFALRAKEIWS